MYNSLVRGLFRARVLQFYSSAAVAKNSLNVKCDSPFEILGRIHPVTASRGGGLIGQTQ